MSMGKRKLQQQGVMFVAATQLPQSDGHPYYERVNRILAQAGFDDFVEALCEPFYCDDTKGGRPSIAPGVYFRMLMVGYLEGIDSERGIAWRVADSLLLRAFVGVGLGESTPDHSSLSRIRQRLDAPVYEQVFQFVHAALGQANPRGLLKGKTSGPPGAANMHTTVIDEVVTDKGYHSNDVMTDLREMGIRSYTSEPDRGRRNWEDKQEARDAVYANRRRIRGQRGRQLLRRRGELVERSFAHTYETGNLRRTHLRGHKNILKRLLVHAAGFNLGLLMRHLFGIGTPRGPRNGGRALRRLLLRLWRALRALGGVREPHVAAYAAILIAMMIGCARQRIPATV